jgi:hypothetical protein
MYEDQEEKIQALGNFWWAVLVGAWVLVGFYAVTHERVLAGFFVWALAGYMRKHLKGPAVFMARGQIALTNFLRVKHREIEHGKQIEQATREGREKGAAATLTNQTQEIIKRLGTIDRYLLVLKVESDPGSRTVAMQNVQSEITALEAKKVSGELPLHVLTQPEILNHAQATRDHVAALGLGEDRLNLEFTRLFNDFQPVEPLPKPPTTGAVLGAKAQSAVAGAKQGWSKVSPHIQRIAEEGVARAKSAAGQSEQVQAQEVLTRLIEIDKQLRVIEFGQDTTNMHQVLQAAHSEITALEMKRTTGKIPLHVLTRPDLVSHAKATSDHMVQLGLGNDRLNIELTRLFNGFDSVPPPAQALADTVEIPAHEQRT